MKQKEEMAVLEAQETKFGLKDKITFGKYKGEVIEDIIKTNKSYINWCLDNVQFFNLTPEAKALYMETKTKRYSSGGYSDPGEARGAANQAMVDCFGGSGMDGGWGSSPFG